MIRCCLFPCLGMMSSGELSKHDVTSLSKRVTMLEMKELNERQRADHAVRMYDQQKKQLRQLEDRNFEIEQKFNEVRFFIYVLEYVPGSLWLLRHAKLYKISMLTRH